MSQWRDVSLLELADNKRELFTDGDWIETPFITDKGNRLLQTGNIGVGRLLNRGRKRYISDHSFTLLKCKEVRPGDVLICRLADPAGRACLVTDIGEPRMLTSVDVTIFRPAATMADRHYLVAVFSSPRWFAEVSERCGGSTRTRIARSELGKIRIQLPELAEQRRIAEALGDADALISSLERLITKKQATTQGMMQQLLTGRTRLPGFLAPWKQRRVAEVLAPRNERNKLTEPLEVLSCTKHEGFVRSLDFFNSQVFSRDLSGYRLIYRGDIGYPANHIEEGSIGVQERFDRALVSPIYVVMYPLNGNDPFFIQRQMKLETFRQKFARATNASVDRRGSLRWGEFSQIEVDMPSPEEQSAISRVVREAEREVEVLRASLNKAQAVKLGMMQQLLTGRTRLPVEVDS